MSRLPFEYEIENIEPMNYQHLFLTYEELYNKFPKEGKLIEEITLKYMFGDSLAESARKFENHTRWHLYGIKDERQVNAIFGRVIL